MRSPVRFLPARVERWASRARWLRTLDALAAGLVVWGLLALWLEHVAPLVSAVAAAGLVGLVALARSVRRRWRPLSAVVSLSVSRGLRPGDRAWLVLPERVEPVIVTARHRLHLVVARPDQGPSEGLEIRRTRVLVVPSRRD
jgi:hypothetical protein